MYIWCATVLAWIHTSSGKQLSKGQLWQTGSQSLFIGPPAKRAQMDWEQIHLARVLFQRTFCIEYSRGNSITACSTVKVSWRISLVALQCHWSWTQNIMLSSPLWASGNSITGCPSDKASLHLSLEALHCHGVGQRCYLVFSPEIVSENSITACHTDKAPLLHVWEPCTVMELDRDEALSLVSTPETSSIKVLPFGKVLLVWAWEPCTVKETHSTPLVCLLTTTSGLPVSLPWSMLLFRESNQTPLVGREVCLDLCCIWFKDTYLASRDSPVNTVQQCENRSPASTHAHVRVRLLLR